MQTANNVNNVDGQTGYKHIKSSASTAILKL